ncbi:MAG: helix-turn-helix domain-containing protein, partial [Candidatus Nitrosomaritimum yanchengensis]
LSKNGPKKAIEISRALNIPRTEIYHLLLILKNKGIIIPSRQIRPKRFSAVTIDKAMESLIENQKKKIEELKLLKDDMEFIWRFFQKNLHLTDKKYAQTLRI